MNVPAERKRVTQLLVASESGDDAALDAVLPLVYDELARLARGFLRRERPGHTLNTLALVHEAYLRLVDQERVRYRGRGHFLALAAVAMRRILVNHARDRRRLKRGGEQKPVTLLDDMAVQPDRAEELVALDELLHRLATFDPRAVRVVECRFFAGLTVEETARALDVGTATVKRSWASARAWLQRELATGPGPS